MVLYYNKPDTKTYSAKIGFFVNRSVRGCGNFIKMFNSLSDKYISK